MQAIESERYSNIINTVRELEKYQKNMHYLPDSDTLKNLKNMAEQRLLSSAVEQSRFLATHSALIAKREEKQMANLLSKLGNSLIKTNEHSTQAPKEKKNSDSDGDKT
jgi:hypothetical protein